MKTRILALYAIISVLTFSAPAENPADRSAAREFSAKAAAYIGRPFETTYSVTYKVNTSTKAAQSGTYRLVANDHRWREDVDLGSFKQTGYFTEDRLWTARNVPFEIVPVFFLRQLLLPLLMSPTGNTFLPARPEITLVKERKVKGRRAICVQSEEGKHQRIERCFDAASAELITFQSPNVQTGYSDYASYGNAHLPRRVRIIEGERTVADALLEQVNPAEFAADAFTPPAGTLEIPFCRDATPARYRTGVQPEYPEQAEARHVQGTVYIYALIKEDGSLSNLHVVQSAGKILDQSAMTAVSQWKYDPGTCADHAIPSEMVIAVNYVTAAGR